jgi:hypothetical protein
VGYKKGFLGVLEQQQKSHLPRKFPGSKFPSPYHKQKRGKQWALGCCHRRTDSPKQSYKTKETEF